MNEGSWRCQFSEAGNEGKHERSRWTARAEPTINPTFYVAETEASSKITDCYYYLLLLFFT